jgi:hypothetical protein
MDARLRPMLRRSLKEGTDAAQNTADMEPMQRIEPVEHSLFSKVSLHLQREDMEPGTPEWQLPNLKPGLLRLHWSHRPAA